MELRIAVPESHVAADVLDAGLEVTTRLDEKQIQNGDVPLFRDAAPGSAVLWQPEPPGAEHFDHAKRVLSRGFGDCDDLAPWHAASLRQSGEDPGARACVYQSGPNRWHAVVLRSDGSIDDPSLEAGMSPRGGGGLSGVGYDDEVMGDDDDDDSDADYGDDSDDGGDDASDDGGGGGGGDGGGGDSDQPPAPPAPAPPPKPGAPKPGAQSKPRAPSGGGGRRPPPPRVPPHLSIAPPVLPRMFGGRRPALAVRRTVHGFEARADVPYLDTEYSLAALAKSGVAPTALVGAIGHAMNYARAAGCVQGKHARHMAAIAGMLTGSSPGKIAQLCGRDAVDAGLPLVHSVVGLARSTWVSDDWSVGQGQGPSAPLLPPQQVHNAMAKAVNSPLLPPTARKLARIVGRHATGPRPPANSLKGSIMQWFATTQGPVPPNSPDDHARLLLADQAAKHLTRPGAPLAGIPPEAPLPRGASTVGDLFGDIGKALGDAGKAVAQVVKQVGPTVATVAAVLPPPYGPAISLAATGAVALAKAAVPDASPSSTPQASTPLASQAALHAASVPGAAAAAHPSMVPGGPLASPTGMSSAQTPRYIHFVPGTGGHVLVSFA